MSRKRYYPGGFRLTLKAARALAVREFGTARELKQDERPNMQGVYEMTIGNMTVTIEPDMDMSGCIKVRARMRDGDGESVGLFNRETLEADYDAMEKARRRERREAFEEWVSSDGPEPCHRAIDDFWNKR